ncbi:MAG: hypothetical protein IPI27_13605, partial [Betaproteobacteria bacterium]|nr:hypothetical protein [Betaproteobacteria bacterium]
TLSDLHCEFGAFDVGLKLLLGERITVTHPIGLTAKDFRIVAISDDGFGRYTIAGAEYDAAQWSDAVVSTPTTVDSGLVASGTPPTLTGLAAVEEIYRTGDGLISSRLRITWTDPAWPGTLNYLVAMYEVSTLIHTGTAWDEIYVSPALQEGKSYRVDVAIISKAGVAGTAVSTSISMVGKIGTLPGNVPAFEATEAGGKVYARWSAATDLDTLDYELRYGAVGVSWDAATYINRLASLAYVIEGIPAGTWDFLIKARDSYKQYSATEAEKTLTVTLDANATTIGNVTFPSGTLTAMVLGVVADLDRWDTDNGDGWGYGHTDTNNATGSWTDASAIVNTAWATQNSATTIRWASDVWDLGPDHGRHRDDQPDRADHRARRHADLSDRLQPDQRRRVVRLDRGRVGDGGGALHQGARQRHAGIGDGARAGDRHRHRRRAARVGHHHHLGVGGGVGATDRQLCPVPRHPVDRAGHGGDATGV